MRSSMCSSRYYLRQGGYVFNGVSLFVCYFRGLRKKCSTDFNKIRWKWLRKKRLDFGVNPNRVYLMVRVRVELRG